MVVRLVGVDPGGDFIEHLRGDGFFDRGVLADRSGFGRLEEMVEAGELQDFKVLVAAIGERLTDGRKVLRGRDLSVKASTEGQHRDVQLGEVRGRVIGEEVAVPGRGDVYKRQEPYLRQILKFIGIENVQIVRVEGLNVPPLAASAIPNAEKAINELVL